MNDEAEKDELRTQVAALQQQVESVNAMLVSLTTDRDAIRAERDVLKAAALQARREVAPAAIKAILDDAELTMNAAWQLVPR